MLYIVPLEQIINVFAIQLFSDLFFSMVIIYIKKTKFFLVKVNSLCERLLLTIVYEL